MLSSVHTAANASGRAVIDGSVWSPAVVVSTTIGGPTGSPVGRTTCARTPQPAPSAAAVQSCQVTASAAVAAMRDAGDAHLIGRGGGEDRLDAHVAARFLDAMEHEPAGGERTGRGLVPVHERVAADSGGQLGAPDLIAAGGEHGGLDAERARAGDEAAADRAARAPHDRGLLAVVGGRDRGLVGAAAGRQGQHLRLRRAGLVDEAQLDRLGPAAGLVLLPHDGVEVLERGDAGVRGVGAVGQRDLGRRRGAAVGRDRAAHDRAPDRRRPRPTSSTPRARCRRCRRRARRRCRRCRCG